jgi:hypothetical protein
MDLKSHQFEKAKGEWGKVEKWSGRNWWMTSIWSTKHKNIHIIWQFENNKSTEIIFKNWKYELNYTKSYKKIKLSFLTNLVIF